MKTCTIPGWRSTSTEVDDQAAELRLAKAKGKQQKEPEQKAVAAKRDEDNARLEQEIAERKAGAVSYEDYLKMKERNESNAEIGTGT